jgi:hypothetical protein
LGDLSGTKRAVVLFGADDQPWGKTVGALTSGLRADGPVTLVLERDDDPARAEAWTPAADENDDDAAAGSAGVTDRDRGGGGASPGGTARRGDGSVGSAAGGGSRGSRGSSAGSGLDANGERRRVGGGRAGVPDPVNASLAVALTAFVALIVTGFTTP